MKRISPIAALGLSLIAIPAAFAADGYVTGNVNLRAGPDSSYPRVAMLNAGTPVAIEGCIDSWSWCDVATAEERGWVAGNFLQEEYQGQRVLIPEYGLQIGIPIVSFAFGAYWDQHYRSRSWYGNRAHWSHVQPQYSSGRESSYRNSRDATYGNSRSITSGDSRATYAPTSRAPETRRSAVVTPPPGYQGRVASTPPPHPVANDFRSQEKVVGHERPVERNTGESRAMAQQNAIATQKSTESNLQRKEKPARSTPEREGGKDNERGKDKDQQH
jgi:uncharacterized protein YraI